MVLFDLATAAQAHDQSQNRLKWMADTLILVGTKQILEVSDVTNDASRHVLNQNYSHEQGIRHRESCWK